MNQGISDKYVVPQWLPFRVASQQREHSAFSRTARTLDYSLSRTALQDALEDFRASPSIFVATELMGVASVIGLTDTSRELAEYVLSQPLSGAIAQEQARRLLGKVTLPPTNEREAVRTLKLRLADYPRDAISWVDQARMYTVMGQRRKADRAIRAALHLAPADRFVVRAAIRYFIHYDEWDEAYRAASAAYSLNPDPLIFGPLLSVGSHLEKMPSRFKNVSAAALAAEEPFVYSEALEALGTLEVFAGADQRAKKFFRKAWIDPTIPVIGHSQWIIRDRIPGLAADRTFDFNQSHEALSWLRFAFLDFEGAVHACNAWALEEPYSRSPYVLGTIAAGHAERFDIAIEIGLRGLKANPKDHILLNNIAFAYLRKGDAVSARKYFTPLLALVERPEEIAPTATYGLLLMSEGDTEKGTQYYFTAIDRAVKAGNGRTALRASLQLIISTLETTKTMDPALIRSAIDALTEYQDPGCFGAALAINRRLQAANLKEAPELGTAAKEFAIAVEREASRYVSSVQGRFIDVIAPLQRAPLPAEATVRGLKSAGD